MNQSSNRLIRAQNLPRPPHDRFTRALKFTESRAKGKVMAREGLGNGLAAGMPKGIHAVVIDDFAFNKRQIYVNSLCLIGRQFSTRPGLCPADLIAPC